MQKVKQLITKVKSDTMAAFKRIVLVTGGNTGLGLEIVRALAKSSNSYEIIIGSRSTESGSKAIKTVQDEVKSASSSTLSVVQVDLESDNSLKKAIAEISEKFGRLDVLVNNAGAQFDAQIAAGKLTVREAFNKSWDVNVSGTHVLTLEAVPLLLKSDDPRLLFLTSGTAPLAETELTEGPIYSRLNGSPEAGWPKPAGTMGLPAYRSVKTGLNMVMRDWVRILRNDGVKIWSISPGMLATGLGGVGPDKLRAVSISRIFLGVS